MSDAIVVGAGAGGLAAAWQLARSGRRVLVLESAARPGGLLGRVELDGLALDTGAEGFSVRGGAVAQLLADLGAAERIVQPEPVGAWLQTSTGALRIPQRLYFGLPADPEAADVRAVVGEVPPPAVPPPGSTMADLTRAGYGQRVLDDLVTPLVGGVYSTSPNDIRLADLAPTTAAQVEADTPLREAVRQAVDTVPPGGAVNGIGGGMHRLVDLLLAADERGSGSIELRCGQPVSAVELHGSRWRVTTPSGVETAELLVLAVPLDIATRLLGGPPPSGQPTLLNVITLVLDETDLADAPRGTGVLVGANVPGVAAKALTHSTAKWAWLRAACGAREVLRLSYGRRGQLPITAELASDDLRRLVVADASALLGRPVGGPVALVRTEWRILPVGTPGVVAAREWLTGQRSDHLALVGAGVAGVGLAAVVPQARAEIERVTTTRD